MIDKVPLIAPTSPPLTGASSMATPRSCKAAATSRVTLGDTVLISMTTAPSLAPCIRALLAHEHGLHIGRVRDDADDDIRSRRRLLGRADAHAAGGDDLVNARPVAAVVNPEFITGFEQVLGPWAHP